MKNSSFPWVLRKTTANRIFTDFLSMKKPGKYETLHSQSGSSFWSNKQDAKVIHGFCNEQTLTKSFIFQIFSRENSQMHTSHPKVLYVPHFTKFLDDAQKTGLITRVPIDALRFAFAFKIPKGLESSSAFSEFNTKCVAKKTLC